MVRLCRNLGIGGAVQTGLRLALREGYDCALQIDGDGQHPPLEAGALLDRLRRSDPARGPDRPVPDLIIGTRFARGDGFRSTFVRRLGISWLRIDLLHVEGHARGRARLRTQSSARPLSPAMEEELSDALVTNSTTVSAATPRTTPTIHLCHDRDVV